MNHLFSIVGMNHLKTEDVVKAIPAGAELKLVREPDNKFDKNAVMVWYNGVHVGYIPKNKNVGLGALIESKGQNWAAPPKPGVADAGAMDSKESVAVRRAIDATLTRSPNSGYPMATVSEQV